MKTRKTDRRTIYTLGLIKEAFLRLTAKEPYSKMTVAQLCRTAEITRSTFYIHYNNLTEVLNAVLDDALQFSLPTGHTALEAAVDAAYLKQNESLLPACQRIADSPRYRALLMDSDLSEYIIGRIAQHERPQAIPEIKARTGLDTASAEVLFQYMVHGSFAINKRHHFIKDDQWYQEVSMLNRFVAGGYKALLG